MNRTFNLYNLSLKGNKAVGSDIVTPWIDDLLDKQDAHEVERTAVILPYPVDKVLAAVQVPEVSPVVPDLSLVSASAEKSPDIRLVSSITKSELPVPSVSPGIDLEEELSYFTFMVGGSYYALPSLSINEIIRYKTPVNIFSKKPGHMGIILYRNKMMPVYDFSMIANGVLNTKAALKYIIVCIYDNKFFGLSINEIKNITKVKNKSLISSSTFKFRNSNNITSEVFEDSEGKFYSVADLESIFKYITY